MDQGTVIIHPKEFPKGIIIVLAASPVEEPCGTNRCSLRGNVTDPEKLVTITIESNGSDSDYTIATLAVVGFYVAIIILTLSISLLVNFRHKISYFENLKIGEKIDLSVIELSRGSKDTTADDVKDAEISNENEDILRETAFDENNSNEGASNFRRKRIKTHLFVNDLSGKLADPSRSKSVYQKSQLYLGILFLVSQFYALPTLQMVFAFSDKQRGSGNQDICYYNDLCRKPFGQVRDFNHVLSNLGYCAFGLLFMGIVLIKQVRYHSFLTNNTNIGKVHIDSNFNFK